MNKVKEKNRVETFIDSLENQNIGVLETEWSRDSFVVKIDLSCLAELDRMDSEEERRRQIDRDRVVYKDTQFIIQHPYGKTSLSAVTLEQAKHWIPQPLKDVLEVKIVDKTILDACERKYEDNWLPCDGMCGDPDHLEFASVEVIPEWFYDGKNLTLTVPTQELGVLVRKALQDVLMLEGLLAVENKEETL